MSRETSGIRFHFSGEPLVNHLLYISLIFKYHSCSTWKSFLKTCTSADFQIIYIIQLEITSALMVDRRDVQRDVGWCGLDVLP